MPFSTNTDLLNTDLIIFFFKKSLPVMSAKSRKRDVTAYIKMARYVDTMYRLRPFFLLRIDVLVCFQSQSSSRLIVSRKKKIQNGSLWQK